MSNSSSSSSRGTGLAGLLAIVFITLKLCKVIDWSWWWVLAPIWICFLIGFIIVFGCYFRNIQREDFALYSKGNERILRKGYSRCKKLNYTKI
ncbi:MAG: hypothetical protein WC450_09890 [Candidatus Omnitrophota bacterium]